MHQELQRNGKGVEESGTVMRVAQTIRIEQIDRDKVRLPINKKALIFALALLRGDIFPPISVQRKGGKYIVHDGRHRLAAHKLTGRETIRANVAIKEDPNPFKPLVCKR
jgi:uncharacterized ParB-like nuclease family protein